MVFVTCPQRVLFRRWYRNWKRWDHWSLLMAEAVRKCLRTQSMTCSIVCSKRPRNLWDASHRRLGGLTEHVRELQKGQNCMENVEMWQKTEITSSIQCNAIDYTHLKVCGLFFGSDCFKLCGAWNANMMSMILVSHFSVHSRVFGLITGLVQFEECEL